MSIASSMKLNNADYKTILNYYKLSIPNHSSTLKKKAEQILFKALSSYFYRMPWINKYNWIVIALTKDCSSKNVWNLH